MSAEQWPLLARRVCLDAGRPWSFLPALVDEVHPRLALAFEREGRGYGLLVSGAEPQVFLQELRMAAVPPVEDATAATVDGPRRTLSQQFGLDVGDDSVAPLRASTRPPRPSGSSAPPPPSSSGTLRQAGFGALHTRNARVALVFRKLQQGLDASLPVLLEGERDSGRSLVARELHRLSCRAKSPLVVVDCSVLPAGELQRELFGDPNPSRPLSVPEQERGAWHRALGGTLLLEDADALPEPLQRRLITELRTPRAVDASQPWLIASLGAPGDSALLRSWAEAGEALRVYLPPLRERPEDLLELSMALLAEEGFQAQPCPEALVLLQIHDWPGNFAELREVLRRAARREPERSLLPASAFEMRRVAR